MTGEEKIIYVVVAETVQHPLTSTIIGNRLVRLDTTRTIVQIPGRLAAQACHAVRRMGHHMVIEAVKEVLGFNGIISLKKLKQALRTLTALVVYEPTTTIILSCRDSFELEHTYNLLRDHAGVLAFKFNDTNPLVYCAGCRLEDYSRLCKDMITTAFATVPVTKQEVQGYLDYLPLWTPKS
jgi:hypothetical protein